MNANELLDLGNELAKLNSDNLVQKCIDDNDVQNYIYYSVDCLDRSRIRETATEPPTREDADKVLCTIDDGGDWSFKRWYQIADSPSTYVMWFVMPDVQLPEVTP